MTPADACEQIRQLAARYALAMDMRDFAALATLFTEDCATLGGATGRAALEAEFTTAFRTGTGGRVGFTLVGGHVIDLVDADHARGSVHCLAELGDDERWVRQAIVYQDEYERHAGRWLFARRDHQLFYGLELDERPLAQPPADWPRGIVGRGTLPYAWPTWRAFVGEPG
ncbi:hypothetical protein DSM104299_04038 [Baekduia alba]|uniref:nuclear transport factor 2 family protein n=1 Tax=Baekduia alba TaxID=2997333 RepID=UPI002340EED9|nr:nuclear transport factor 2 family protein [Baekduia alba]WCB95295.1 hypothetical protein DSM104299_04038 [Baekduia alba]